MWQHVCGHPPSVTDTFLLTFFFARELRDWSLERDQEVSRTGSCVWPGGQAGRWFVWAVWPDACLFLSAIFVLCNVNWKTLTASLFDCYILGYKIPE